jgi:regulator of chromosome condensation
VEDGLPDTPGKHETSFPIPSVLEAPVRGSCAARVVHIVAGNEHILVLAEKGGISICGRSEQGRLGWRVPTCREINGTLPEKVVLGARSRKAVKITAGGFTSFAVDMVGDVWAWSSSSRARLTPALWILNRTRSRTPPPKKAPGVSKAVLGGAIVVDVAVEDHHVIFLTDRRCVLACGNQLYSRIRLASRWPKPRNGVS